MEHHHKDKGAYDLGLVFSRTPYGGIELGKVFHDGGQIKNAKLFPCGAEFEMEPCALGRIHVNFCPMHEMQIFPMGLPLN